MLASQIAVFLVLVMTLRAVGVGPSEISIVEAFAAWSLIRALGSIPITPGGFGIEELAPDRARSSVSGHRTRRRWPSR